MKNLKPMTRIKSLGSSTFLKNCHGPMAFRSSSLSNGYVPRIMWNDCPDLTAL
jgi:hypothetical protein